MKKYPLILAALLCLATACNKNDDKSDNVQAPVAAIPVPAMKATNTEGKWVVYDLHLTFFEDVEVTSVEVLFNNISLLNSPGAFPISNSKRHFVKSIWIPNNGFAPGTIKHRISYKAISNGAQKNWEKSYPMKSPDNIQVAMRLPLDPTKYWVAANAPSPSSRHTNALISYDQPVFDSEQDGYIYGANPQRFAIDFVSLENGLPFKNDGKKLGDWYCYGDSIFAAWPGKVMFTADNFPDHKTPGELDYTITLDNIGGNVVYIDHQDGTVGFYAHFMQGSIAVKPGELVPQGKFIGLLGNSGNSTAPHLHFHVVANPDGKPFTKYPDGLFRQGIAYTFTSFNSVGLSNDEILDAGTAPFQPSSPKPYTNCLPVEYEVMYQ